jgi:hypothetical protein
MPYYLNYILNSVGAVLILISTLGYLSNKLNWEYLNYGVTHLLYDFGAVVHETSHAIICFFTGAKIIEYKIFAKQPRVTYTEPKLPLIGNALISFAPIAGGLLTLYLINRFLLAGYFVVPEFHSWNDMPLGVWNILRQIDILNWQSWVVILLFINVGAMMGPSYRDLINTWPIVVLLLFVRIDTLMTTGLLALALIVVNILIQFVVIVLFQAFRLFRFDSNQN